MSSTTNTRKRSREELESQALGRIDDDASAKKKARMLIKLVEPNSDKASVSTPDYSEEDEYVDIVGSEPQVIVSGLCDVASETSRYEATKSKRK